MRKLTLLIALLLVAGLALVACGGATPEQVAEEAAEVVGEEVVATAEAVVEEMAPTEEAAAEEVMATEEPAAEEPAAEEATGDKTVVRWFIGLGTGGNEQQLAVQEAVVAAFNEANPDIELQMEVVQNLSLIHISEPTRPY